MDDGLSQKAEDIKLGIFIRQGKIIRLQSEVIDDLFLLLLQHISAEEADRLPVMGKIETAVRLREGVE